MHARSGCTRGFGLSASSRKGPGRIDTYCRLLFSQSYAAAIWSTKLCRTCDQILCWVRLELSFEVRKGWILETGLQELTLRLSLNNVTPPGIAPGSETTL